MLMQDGKEKHLGPTSPLDLTSTLHIYAVKMLRNQDPGENRRTE